MRDARLSYYASRFKSLQQPGQLWTELRRLGQLKTRKQDSISLDLDELNAFFVEMQTASLSPLSYSVIF